MRYLAQTQFACKKLVLYAGGIPNELVKEDFTYLSAHNTEILSIVGDADEYLTPKLLEQEKEKLEALFDDTVQQIRFKGGHEVKKEIIRNLGQ
jgi:hypothetical protein